MVGDGCYVSNQPIHYTNGDINNIKMVEDISIRLFNISPRLVRQGNWYHLYLPTPYRLARGNTILLLTGLRKTD